MFIDARSIPNGTTIDTDIAIIGAGAAGITLALEFANRSMRVALLEGGGLEWDARSQDLYEGEISGVDYSPLSAARIRFFGGSTNHWAGQCRPLDDIDFTVRPWVPHSGWPIGRSDLEPYYARAHEVCKLGPYVYDPAAWETDHHTRLPLDAARFETLISRVAPTRFGLAYGERVQAARNVDTYLHANVVELQTNEAATTVTRAKVRTLDGAALDVAARVFVLATGGIENARLLLASRSTERAGLGNRHDLVGRFFMEHTSVSSGVYIPSDETWELGIYANPITQPGTDDRGFAYLALPPSAQERENVLNVRVRLRNAGWLEALEAMNHGMSAARNERAMADRMRHLIRDIDGLSAYGYRRLFRPLPDAFWVDVQAEQAPNPESRVRLSAERDALGQPRAELHWQVSDLDVFTTHRAAQLIAEEFGRAGLGRLRKLAVNPDSGWPYAREGLRWGFHHIGTTRMHTDPRQGVVDAHCRVHDVANLYVAGSSVFPTGGHVNPTLTIVALAIRLADELKKTLR